MKTWLSNVARGTRFWNNLHLVRLWTVDWNATGSNCSPAEVFTHYVLESSYNNDA